MLSDVEGTVDEEDIDKDYYILLRNIKKRLGDEGKDIDLEMVMQSEKSTVKSCTKLMIYIILETLVNGFASMQYLMEIITIFY